MSGQMAIAGEGLFLFPSNRIRGGHQTTFKNMSRWIDPVDHSKCPVYGS